MTIKSAILASTPLVYWPLDDISSSVAVDATGNGHGGVFTSSTALGAPGPETGTTCLATGTNGAGVLAAGNNPMPGTVTFSAMCWLAAQSYVVNPGQVVYSGLSSTNGAGLALAAAVEEVLFGGLGVTSSGHPLTVGFWHQIACVIVASTRFEQFADGVSLINTVNPTAYLPVLAGNPLLGFSPNPGLIAHVAFWTRALTGAEVATIWAAGPGLVRAAPITGRTANDADVLALESKIDTILASVRKTY